MATNNLRFVSKNGLDNNGNTLTNLGVVGASLTQSGAFALTLTTTGATNVTFPTSGTLLTTAGTSALATSLAAGAAGALPYQSATGTTSFLSAGTTSQVLVGGASAPSWSNTPTLTGTNFTGIPNAALTNNSITIGSTNIALGGTSTTLAGLTSVSATTFTGALTGAASLNVLKAGDTMTGALIMPLGAVTTPSLTFTGDLNTGIWSSAADTLNFSTGGSERLRITSAGLSLFNLTAAASSAPIQSLASTSAAISFTSIGRSADDISVINFLNNAGTTEKARIQIAADDSIFIAQGSSATNRFRINADGNVSIGTAAAGAGQSLVINKTQTGAVNSHFALAIGTVQSDVTSSASGFSTSISTAAASFTLGTLSHINVAQGTFGAGSAVTTQHGLNVSSGMTGATNNYAATLNLPAGTGRRNLNATGTADNYMAGALGIGTTSITGFTLRTGKAITGSAYVRNIYAGGEVQTDVTSGGTSLESNLQLANGVAMSGNWQHVGINQGTFGTGTLATQYGLRVNSTLIGATTNIGISSSIPSGTNRWNLHIDGTADNYFVGNVGLGTPTPLTRLDVRDGYITAGTVISTSGSRILAGYYSDGAVTTFGSEYANGGPVIGYGVWPSTSAAQSFISSTGINAARGAYTVTGSNHIWYGGGAQTVSVGGAVTMSERMRIDTSGQLGVGTSTPQQRLDVEGNIQISGDNNVRNLAWSMYDQTKNVFLEVDGAVDSNTLKIGTNNTERMRITSTGNVGIGTTSPTSLLHIKSASPAFILNTTGNITTGSVAYINFNADAGTGDCGLLGFAGSANTFEVWNRLGGSMRFATNNTERMRIDASGNVGIGNVANNGFKLDLTGASTGGTAGNQSLLFSLRNNNSNASILEITDTRTNTGTDWTTAGIRLQQKIDSTWMAWQSFGGYGNSSGITWGTGQSATSAVSITEKMRLNLSGNLGIGTSTPSTRKLHVDAANAATPGVYGLRVTQEGFTSTAGELLIDTTSTGRVVLSSTTTYPLAFDVNGTERMRLDAAGNVGIGNTPSGTYKLEVAGDVYGRNLTVGHISGLTSSGYISLNDYNGTQRQIMQTYSSSTSSSLTIGDIFNGLPSFALVVKSEYTQLQATGPNITEITLQDSYIRIGESLSGYVYVGGNSTTVQIGTSGNYTNEIFAGQVMLDNNAQSSGYEFTTFNRSGTQIGSITQNGTTAVLYNTTSDARLKENIQPAQSFGDLIDNINVVSFDWKNSNEHQRAGMIAQDLATIAPEAVKVGDTNEEITTTWGVDYSKLVPMLVKEIQELRARVASLEAKN